MDIRPAGQKGASPAGAGVNDTIRADDFLANPFHPMYDVTPDGKRLLLLEGDANQRQLTVILNWTRSLEGRLATKK